MDCDKIEQNISKLSDGVYYGFAQVVSIDKEAIPMVMSLGSNVTIDAHAKKTFEVHILKSYDKTFYDHVVKVMIVGYLRPMEKYDGIDTLIAAIKQDIEDAKIMLAQPHNHDKKNNVWFNENV